MNIDQGLWVECMENNRDAMLIEGYKNFVFFFISGKERMVHLSRNDVVQVRDKLNKWLEEK